MNRTFSTVTTNVGNNVQDTDASFATKIQVLINNRYREIWDRCIWTETINKSYTFSTVAGTSDYNLYGDFGEELNVINTTDGIVLKRYLYDDWMNKNGSKYSSGTLTNETTSAYAISGLNTSGTPVLTLLPPPDAVKTISVIYKRAFAPLINVTGTCTTDTASKIIASASTFITSGVVPGMRVKNTTDGTYAYVVSVDSETQLTMDSDVCPDGNETFTISNEFIIEGIDYCVELGATADALLLKRRPSESAFYMQQYETYLRRRIGRQKSQPNQIYQFAPEPKPYNVYGNINWGSNPYA